MVSCVHIDLEMVLLIFPCQKINLLLTEHSCDRIQLESFMQLRQSLVDIVFPPFFVKWQFFYLNR